jgi:2-iminoacetate synthase ThiH
MNLDAIDRFKERTMAETEITSFTPSELMHSLTLKWIDDPVNYTPEQYLQAYEIARIEHRSIFEAADPSAARAERQQRERRLELEGRAEESS